MPRLQTLTSAALILAGTASHALAQQMNPAPAIKETGPSGTNSSASNVAATDFNWVWLSLVVAALAMVLWYLARRRQSGPTR